MPRGEEKEEETPPSWAQGKSGFPAVMRIAAGNCFPAGLAREPQAMLFALGPPAEQRPCDAGSCSA